MKSYREFSFSDKIRWRSRLLRCLLIFMLVYMIAIGEMGLGDSRMMSTLADDVSRTIFFGGMLWVISKIIRNQRLLNDRGLLKAQMRREYDERNQYLHDKSGGFVWDALFVCLLLVTLTASLTSMPAFYTSFAILAIAVLLKLAAYFVYKARA